MRMLTLTGESGLVTRAEAADPDGQRPGESFRKDLQHALEIHNAPGTPVLKVVLAHDGTGCGFPDTVEPYQRAMYLLKGIGQESAAELPCNRRLHGLKKVAHL